MRKGRIDYRIRRRTVLADVASGACSADDVRDAHPDLLRAAEHLSRATDRPCPLCDHPLVHVTYVFDGDPRNRGGRAVTEEALNHLVDRHGDLRVYVVEVCRACHWHHLVESFLLTARPDANLG